MIGLLERFGQINARLIETRLRLLTDCQVLLEVLLDEDWEARFEELRDLLAVVAVADVAAVAEAEVTDHEVQQHCFYPEASS